MAFDALAPTYDTDFTASPIAQHLRARVHSRLARYIKTGDRVLELGCGTGEDALVLAQRGVHVVATDASAGMLDAARAKTAHEPNIVLAQLDLNALTAENAKNAEYFQDSSSAPAASSAAQKSFSSAFSNFGVINCVSDRAALARWLADRVRPDSTVAFGVMARYCLWEIGWHLAPADLKIAFRRVGGVSQFTIDDQPPMTIFYPTVHQITREFAPYFRRVHLEPLGLLLPPSALYPIVEKRPRLLRRLTAWDDRLLHAMLSQFADHYWIEFERLP